MASTAATGGLRSRTSQMASGNELAIVNANVVVQTSMLHGVASSSGMITLSGTKDRAGSIASCLAKALQCSRNCNQPLCRATPMSMTP